MKKSLFLFLIIFAFFSNYDQENFEKGLKIIENESIGNLKINQKIDEAIDLIGNPVRKDIATYDKSNKCYYQTWFFNKGIRLRVMKKQNDITIKSIIISSPCEFKTKKEIKIGSTFTEVEEKYIDKINWDISSFSSITIGTEAIGLTFFFNENDIVHEIHLINNY